MTGVDVRVTGINDLVGNLKKIDKKLFDSVIQDVAEKTYVYAKQNAAEDTGELEDSINYTQQSNGWVVYATAKHAEFNEYGSWNIKKGGRVSKSGKVAYTPFLRPAAHKAIREAPKKFQDKLTAIWR